MNRLLPAIFFVFFTLLSQSETVPTFDEMAASKLDVWGEAAIRRHNGPSYEFFEPLLPPLRYVNADFRYYPIVLSAPNAKIKARLISNGSGINLRAGARSWNDVGTPVVFRVGPDEFRFGENPRRLKQPTLAEGYLPIPAIQYFHDGKWYQVEAFAATDPALAAYGVVFAKFSLAEGTDGQVTVEVDSRSPLKFSKGRITDEQGRTLACCDSGWKWERGGAHAKIVAGKFATIAIATKPLDSSVDLALDNSTYEKRRRECIDTWEKFLSGAMSLKTPEPYVNNAWRNLLIQNLELVNGDSIHYSAGNQYDKLYEAEGSEAMLAMMEWGCESDARRLIPSLLDFTRKNLEFHQAGHKIDDISLYYWQTRDAAFVNAMRPRWQAEADMIVRGRTNEHGLFRKEQYCGDIATPVYSLNSNSKCWMALHELAAVLADMGEKAEAARLSSVAVEFRAHIVAALDENIRRETSPPFIPLGLYFNEEIHDPITATRLGDYWNLMINSVLYSGILNPDREDWIPKYLELHGGLVMGMIRAGAEEHTFWTAKPRINPLYGVPYVLSALKRDDADRALVSFYGMLAQGLTRNTYIGAEGSALDPLDEGGRFFYCPPNSAANGFLLITLRELLAQSQDLDGDGKPETLRLCFATPKSWLEDGKTIKFERAPTAFGPVSVKMESHLSNGNVSAEVSLPERNKAEKIFLRARVPDGWKVTGAAVGSEKLSVDDKGTVNLTSFAGKQVIQFEVAPL